jgi:hypothetical protein
MTDESKEARTLSRKFTNAAISLMLLWVGTFFCGVAVIVLIRAWMWIWQNTEL